MLHASLRFKKRKLSLELKRKKPLQHQEDTCLTWTLTLALHPLHLLENYNFKTQIIWVLSKSLFAISTYIRRRKNNNKTKSSNSSHCENKGVFKGINYLIAVTLFHSLHPPLCKPWKKIIFRLLGIFRNISCFHFCNTTFLNLVHIFMFLE